MWRTTGRVTSGDDSIYWELVQRDGGEADPVVVLTHGAGGTHAVWFQQVPVLAERFRVVAWDSRGFGNSTVRGGVSAPNASADLAAVLDHLEIGSAHLVGQSMGGWWTTAFALGHPDRVESIAYCDTAGGLWTAELRTAFAEFTAEGGLLQRSPVGHHTALSAATAERDLVTAFLYEALGSFHEPPMRQVGSALVDGEYAHADVAALGVPVLFLAGEDDVIFPAHLLQASAGLIPGAAYVEIRDAGHSPYFEQPAAFNVALLDFLTGVTAGSVAAPR